MINYHIISLTGEVLAHKTSFTLPNVIDIHVSSQESEWSCMLGISILPMFQIFGLDFTTVLTLWYLLFCLVSCNFSEYHDSCINNKM